MMVTLIVSAREAINNARAALQHKDRLMARHWAQHALAIDPRLEEAWLILAAVAHPRASLAYLKQALEINPASARARQGMDWARRRLQAEAQTTPSIPFIKQTANTQKAITRGRASVRQSFISIIIIALMLMTVAWVFRPGPVSPSEARTADPIWSALGIIKPTYTPTSTATSTPTNTSTPTATFTPSPTATETSTPTPTFTPTDTPTETPTATPSPTATPFQPAPPTPIPAHNKSIIVSISQQHLWAYEGDTLIYSFVASTGMNNSTRVGSFAVQSKIPNAYGANWNIWMPYWLGIYWSGSLENGIHALPILSNGATLWAGYLGTPISYGCVVLGTYEAALLYNWAEIGTPVIIRR